VALVQALATLPAVNRRAVIMFYLADMSLADIAEFEDISENAVKQRLHRARAALTTALSDPHEEVGRG
jgi:RNA polymerase sigma-70 factor (ECF subfamily)